MIFLVFVSYHGNHKTGTYVWHNIILIVLAFGIDHAYHFILLCFILVLCPDNRGQLC